MRRTLNFNVDASGSVDKRMPQFGGVRGEHHATEIVFTMSATAPYKQGDLVRLRFVCGDGAVLSSDLVEDVIVQDGRMRVAYALPSVLTQAGGQLGVRVVFSRVDEDGRESETFLTEEAVLYFEDSASENGTPFWTGVSEMLKRTATASDTAVAARDAAIAEKHEAEASADKASRFAQAAEERALETVSAEKNAQLYASAALSHKSDAETALMEARSASSAANGSARIADEASVKALKAQADAVLAAARAEKEAQRLAQIDIDTIVQSVAQAIGVPVFGTIGDDKTITLNGGLPDGVYTLRYLTADGYADIGTITVGGVVPEEPTAPDTTLTWELGTKIESDGRETTGTTVYSASNFIAIADGYTYTFSKPVTSDTVGVKVCYYDKDKVYIKTSGDVIAQTKDAATVSIPLEEGAAYVRIRLYATVAQVAQTAYALYAEAVA